MRNPVNAVSSTPVTYRAALIGCGRMGAFIDNELDDPFPYSHAAGYEACDRTELVALSDARPEVMAKAGERYAVPTERQFVDYVEMLRREQPDIVSVATQPEERAQIVITACELGVKAIYGEKPMAASLAEAGQMVTAMEAAGVHFNMGTNRRWNTGYDAMYELVRSGKLGSLKTLIVHSNSTLFNTASHTFDLLSRLNNDCPVSWVQAFLGATAPEIEGNKLRRDPEGQGMLWFKNGVVAYALDSGRGLELEAVCEAGTVTAVGSDHDWTVRESGGLNYRGQPMLVPGTFPQFKRSSGTVNLILDLVNALDTGEPPRGGARHSYANTELIFAMLESYLAGGTHIALPLHECALRLERGSSSRPPKYKR